MSVAINIEEVTKIFGKDTIIAGLSLDIKPGEFFTLLGPSGCGKTTLLRMIIGFNSIDDGQISVDGKIINDIPTNLRNMGMVFQNYAIFPHMSVKENVAFGLKNRKVPKDEIARRVEEILDTVKIKHLKDRMPNQLSGGQQQRVALARAIVIHPEVLLMDEPLSNLDAKLRVEMRNAIKLIQKEIGITTIYVTHDQEEALAVSDRIAVMHGGVIQQIGTPQEIYKRPSNTFVATFIGLSNILKATIGEQKGVKVLEFSDYKVPMTNLSPEVKVGDEVIVSARPEEIFIDPLAQAGIAAKLKYKVFLGVNTHYFLEGANGQELEVIQNTELAGGEEVEAVKLVLDAAKINVFTADGSQSLLAGGYRNETARL
ncbi:MAG TPA: ABC transporter ATP-binding protein [Candidatus Avacidaminococcus intestinavium]|uniref:ABC transporter ATP-binding protein n=1 Tax=Candidatus Avacidaminococcus intestinavium TaxID=2840684 RepID=A0A9D1SKW5_9FIRM|nr:ABC transporter ATP-binding protein [Candidatus Avacidaminococcus intestinavium]